MKILVSGCGKVGFAIVSQLVEEGHMVTVIDKNKDRLNSALSGLDIMNYCGDGCSINTLKAAGIDDTDLYVAAMDSDEANILSCVIAKKARNCKTIARVRNPIYSSEIEFLKKELYIDSIINPELQTADECARIFNFPHAKQIDLFTSSRCELVHYKITEGSSLAGVKLFDIRTKHKCNVLVCMVARGEEVIIPKGNFELKENDVIGIMSTPREVKNFFNKFGVGTRKASNVIIVGGGKAGYYLAKNLIDSGIHVKIIDIDQERCNFLAEEFPTADIIHGDGTDKELLLEEGVENCAGLAALTSIDEENIILSIFAETTAPECKTVTKVNRTNFDDVINKLNIDAIVYPNRLVSDKVLRFARSLQYTMGSDISAFRKLGGGKAEALGFTVKNTSHLTGMPLMSMKLKKNVLICNINRNGKNIIPGGSDTIEVGDNVIIVHANEVIHNLDDILE